MRNDGITSYPDCSYVEDMKIEADPDIGGIGVSETLTTSSSTAEGERKLISN